MTTKLTVKQQRFVDFYDGNATDAARKAGYKGNDNTLGQVGDQNLKKLKIAESIQQRETKRNKPLIADREERQRFWSDVQRGEDIDRVVTEWDEDGNPIETNIHPRLVDRLKASELLGRSEADFTDKTVFPGKDGEPQDIGMGNVEAAMRLHDLINKAAKAKKEGGK